MYTYTYIFMYMCVCMCIYYFKDVEVNQWNRLGTQYTEANEHSSLLFDKPKDIGY